MKRYQMQWRRGSYATVFAVTSLLFIGFGALVVDLSMLRLAEAEIQSVADAGAHAGILRLRASNNRTIADTAVRHVVAQNRVAGLVPTAQTVEFGIFENGVFTPTEERANAVRVAVTVDVEVPFAGFWGAGTIRRGADATAAARALHTLVVMDITNSWGFNAFEDARDGAVTIFDALTATAGDTDRIGLVTFHGMFGTEYTPLMPVQQAVDDGVRDVWGNMRTASRVGVPHDNGCYVGGPTDFSVSECWPQMPREYKDETGTDHAIGIEMAARMFDEHPDPSVYRAMIVVTDGEPAGVGKHELRNSLGHVEDRWRYVYTGERRQSNDVISESIAIADTVWQTQEVHTWVVSYRQNSDWMRDVVHGDGYFVLATNSNDLVTIFQDIAESLPITLVE